MSSSSNNMSVVVPITNKNGEGKTVDNYTMKKRMSIKLKETLTPVASVNKLHTNDATERCIDYLYYALEKVEKKGERAYKDEAVNQCLDDLETSVSVHKHGKNPNDQSIWYKIPFVNMFFDMFFDSVPTQDELTSLLEQIGVLSALLLTVAMAIPMSFDFGELEDARLRFKNTTGYKDSLGKGGFKHAYTELIQNTAIASYSFAISVTLTVFIYASSSSGIETNFEDPTNEKRIKEGEKKETLHTLIRQLHGKSITDNVNVERFHELLEILLKDAKNDNKPRRASIELRKIWWSKMRYVVLLCTLCALLGCMTLTIAYNRLTYFKFIDYYVEEKQKPFSIATPGSSFSFFRTLGFGAAAALVFSLMLISYTKYCMSMWVVSQYKVLKTADWKYYNNLCVILKKQYGMDNGPYDETTNELFKKELRTYKEEMMKEIETHYNGIDNAVAKVKRASSKRIRNGLTALHLTG